MPRFFFHVQMGAVFPDELGTALADDRAAHKVALEIVAQLVRDAADEIWRGDAFRIIVEDERAKPLFTIDVSARRDRPERRAQTQVRSFRSGRFSLWNRAASRGP